MDHMEMVERLREKTGISYEEARAALESTNWDMLDALVSLEKQGKVKGNAHYSTKSDGQTDDGAQPNKPQGETFSDMMRRFGRWLKRMIQRGVENQLCMLNHDGQQILSIPVLLFIVLLLVAFWAVLPLMIVSLFFGCRYLFRGPDLGKDSVNEVVGKATEVADSIKSEFRDAADKSK